MYSYDLTDEGLVDIRDILKSQNITINDSTEFIDLEIYMMRGIKFFFVLESTGYITVLKRNMSFHKRIYSGNDDTFSLYK